MAYLAVPQGTQPDDYGTIAWMVHEGMYSSRSSIVDYIERSPGTLEGLYRERYPAEGSVPRFTVLYYCFPEERTAWRMREGARMSNGEYVPLPPIPGHEGPSPAEIDRFAHLAIDHPGQIAYTPDDVYGVSDRRLTLRPGRYLAKYYPEIPAPVVSDWVQRVHAAGTTAFQVPTTNDPAEIVQVYTGGPRSCMSHIGGRQTGCRHSDCAPGSPCLAYSSGDVHPCEVYGHSPDLRLAYWGPIDRVTGRCLVWPDRKLYGRMYGTTPLETLLKQAGYTSGSMTGARVRAIRLANDRGYVMPYVDGIGSAQLDGEYFILGRSGGYATGSTAGVSFDDDDDDTAYCSHCGENEASEGDLCFGCWEDSWTCDACGDRYYDGDDPNSLEDDDRSYCGSCWESRVSSCECCDTSYFHTDRSHTVRRELVDRGMADHCDTCANDHDRCRSCGDLTDRFTRGSDRRCTDCRPPVWAAQGTYRGGSFASLLAAYVVTVPRLRTAALTGEGGSDAQA